MNAIHAYPRPSLAALRRKPSAAMRDELSFAPRLTRFSRDALYLVFSAFDAPPGTPVWCPSFHCGMEVRAAAEAGFTPRFYRVREDLTIDEQHLAECLDDASGPVLLIHYFGFAQPGTELLARGIRSSRRALQMLALLRGPPGVLANQCPTLRRRPTACHHHVASHRSPRFGESFLIESAKARHAAPSLLLEESE